MADLYTESVVLPQSGFNFENCTRNAIFEKGGFTFPRCTKTGTTIVACLYKDGIVVGADSRATEGNIIADKMCAKVQRLTDSIYACGAGTAADIHKVGEMLSSQLHLLELNTGRKARVISALRIAKQHLFKYQGYVGAYLIIGGVDFYGPHLYDVHAHGSTSKLPYSADGSGSLAALGILETKFKMNMTEAEARALVQEALEAGMHADLSSGNSLNLCIIRKDAAEFVGGIVPSFSVPPENELTYKFKKGTTEVLRTNAKKLKFDVVEEKMDTA